MKSRSVFILLCLQTLICPSTVLAQSSEHEESKRTEREAALFDSPEPTSVDQAKTPSNEADREARLFGADGDEEAHKTEDNKTGKGAFFKRRSEADPEGFLYGARPHWSDAAIEARLKRADKKPVIGGRPYFRANYSAFEKGALKEQPLSTPALLYLFIDSRKSKRIRTFIQGRLNFDFSAQRSTESALSSAGACLKASSDVLNGIGSPNALNSACANNEDEFAWPGMEYKREVELDQFWIKFDIKRTTYVTIGQQRIKWGAARFWNPTDFINFESRDPLAIFDARLGVPMIKLHYPIEKKTANLYAMLLLGEADTPEKVGAALRAEFTSKQAEVTASLLVRNESPLRLGLDFSGGIDRFEVRLEGAVMHGGQAHRWVGQYNPQPLADFLNAQMAQPAGSVDQEALARLLSARSEGQILPQYEDRNDDWIPQVVGGFEWGIPYGDRDTMFLTAEYFYNGAGYSDARLYPWLVLQQEFTPLYVGEHYAAMNLALPRPGRWDDTTFLMSTVGNLSDLSFLSRFDVQQKLMTHMSLYVFAAYHFGIPKPGCCQPGGQICQQGELHLSTEIPAVPGIPGLEAGLSLPAPMFDLGVWLSIAL